MFNLSQRYVWASRRRHGQIVLRRLRKSNLMMKRGKFHAMLLDVEKWADKRFGGRSIAIDNAIDVWGDDGLKRDVRRVRICRPCYREWKKAKKDEPDQY